MTTGIWFFGVALGTYFAALLLYVTARVFQRVGMGVAGSALLSIGFLAHTLGLASRSLHLRVLAATNTYEMLVFYSWVFVFGYLAVELLHRRNRQQLRLVGLGVTCLAFGMLALSFSPLFEIAPGALAPVLRSHWLLLHVSLTVVGEGFFAVAFISSCLLLAFDGRIRRTGRESPLPLRLLDDITYRAVAIGFPLFTLGGLFFGAVWAQHAWGRYWGWDPKEVFTLVTWLVYVIYLHLRVGLGWRGRRTAWVVVLGFLLAVFTFAGVNHLLRGLHSYR